MYVLIEGCDGVGKSTLMKNISHLLTEKGIDHALTKEPGGPKALEVEIGSDFPFGKPYEGFRDLCVNNPQIPGLAKRALYKADSIYNWLNTTKPALAEGKIVISDRGWISDLAYGNVLTGIPIPDLFLFNTSLMHDQHTLTNVILLTLPPEEREARLASNVSDHMDTLPPSTRNEIQVKYEMVVKEFIPPERYLITSASFAPGIVAYNCVEWILSHLPNK